MECWSTGVVGNKGGHEVKLAPKSCCSYSSKSITPSLQYSITPIGAKPLSSKGR